MVGVTRSKVTFLSTVLFHFLLSVLFCPAGCLFCLLPLPFSAGCQLPFLPVASCQLPFSACRRLLFLSVVSCFFPVLFLSPFPVPFVSFSCPFFLSSSCPLPVLFLFRFFSFSFPLLSYSCFSSFIFMSFLFFCLLFFCFSSLRRCRLTCGSVLSCLRPFRCRGRLGRKMQQRFLFLSFFHRAFSFLVRECVAKGSRL